MVKESRGFICSSAEWGADKGVTQMTCFNSKPAKEGEMCSQHYAKEGNIFNLESTTMTHQMYYAE